MKKLGKVSFMRIKNFCSKNMSKRIRRGGMAMRKVLQITRLTKDLCPDSVKLSQNSIIRKATQLKNGLKLGADIALKKKCKL